ncbi:hypothetical protein KKA14_09395 [bacterium]|nr:hypothetical protein [bacterium]
MPQRKMIENKQNNIEVFLLDIHKQWHNADEIQNSHKATEIYGIRLESNFRLQFQVFTIFSGWSDWLEGGDEFTCKTEDSITAIRFRSGIEVQYRVSIDNQNWSQWLKEGKIAGTTQEKKALTNIQFQFVKRRYQIDPVFK